MSSDQFASGWRVPPKDANRDRLCAAVDLWSQSFRQVESQHSVSSTEPGRKGRVVKLLAEAFKKDAIGDNDWVVPNASIQKTFGKANLSELWKSIWSFHKEHVERSQRARAQANAVPVVMFSRINGSASTNAQYQLWEWIERPTDWLPTEVPCFGDFVESASTSTSGSAAKEHSSDPTATVSRSGSGERQASSRTSVRGERRWARGRRRQRQLPTGIDVRLRQRFLIRPETNVVVSQSPPMLPTVAAWVVLLSFVIGLLLLAQAISGANGVATQIFSWVAGLFSSINNPLPSIQ